MSLVKHRLLCVFIFATAFSLTSPGDLFAQDKKSPENVRDWFQLVDINIPAESRYRKLENIDKPPQLFVLVRRNDKPLQRYYSSTSVVEGWRVTFPDLVKNQFPIRLSDPNSRYAIEVWDNDRFSGNEHVFTIEFDGPEILKPLPAETGERDAVITFKPIETPEKYRGINERGWVATAWKNCHERVSSWSSSGIAWWNENLITYDRLKKGEYDLLRDEVVIRNVCISNTRSINESLSKKSTTDEEKDYELEFAYKELVKARKLMDGGKVEAAKVAYQRFLEAAIDDGSIAPPLPYVKEALLAPSVTYVMDYVQARKSLKITEGVDYSKLVISPFDSGLKEALTKDQTHSISYLSEILNGAADVVRKIDREREDSPWTATTGALFAVTGWIGSLLEEEQENRALVKRVYEEFTQKILKGVELSFKHEALNRVLLLELESIKNDSDRSVALLQKSILNSPLFTAEEIAELKRFRVELESLYNNLEIVVGLYRIDLPVRVRILSVSMDLDKVRGTFNDDEKKIIKLGANLQYIAPLVPYYKDRGTADLFFDLWQRLRAELNDDEFDELLARSKIRPDWLKGSDISEALGK